MSKGGGGGGSQTTVQKADPWPGLQPFLKQLYSGAGANYASGGPQYYPGNTVAPLNDATRQAMSMGATQATGANPYQSLLGTANSTLQQNAYGVPSTNNASNATLAGIGGGSQVGTNPMQGYFGSFGNGSYVGSNPSSNYFESAMSGQFLNGNPYTDQMVQAAQRPVVDNFQKAIAPALASQFSLAGRTGSGAHANAFGNAADSLGKTLADQSANIYGSTYNMERGLQQGAAGAVSQQNQFERAQQFQGLQANSAINQFDRSQQLQGAEAASSANSQQQALQQQAALAAPSFAQAGQNVSWDNYSKLLGIGQLQQSQQQDLINADKARFDFNQNRPTMNLQLLNQLLQGGAAYAGKTSTENNSLNRNPFNSALGGAATTYGLGSMFGGEAGAAMMGPLGLIGGALAGGLFG